MAAVERGPRPAVGAGGRGVAGRVALWAGFAAAIDLGTKLAAAALHARGVLPRLIVQTQNPDFSMRVATAARPVMILLSLLFLIGFGAWCVRLALAGRLAAWVPGLLIGGGLANLADRVAFGAVHDWLRLGSINFNLADFLVLGGVIGWVIAMAPDALKTRGYASNRDGRADAAAGDGEPRRGWGRSRTR